MLSIFVILGIFTTSEKKYYLRQCVKSLKKPELLDISVVWENWMGKHKKQGAFTWYELFLVDSAFPLSEVDQIVPGT